MGGTIIHIHTYSEQKGDGIQNAFAKALCTGIKHWSLKTLWIA